MLNYNEILESAFGQATTQSESMTEPLPDDIAANIDHLVAGIDKNKSLVSAFVTSLVKKIHNPEQDIRLPREDFAGGYSGRSLDTRFVTPFFKRHFPRYANKESAFLTLATRERRRWTKAEEADLKIRGVVLRRAFVDLHDWIQTNPAELESGLVYLLARLRQLTATQESAFSMLLTNSDVSGILNITGIIEMLAEHFSEGRASRLPVIAVYTAYQFLFIAVKRYDGKVLAPLNVHTASDKHGYGGCISKLRGPFQEYISYE
jgi:DNA (cytosine-5)-methyltransferase 1